MVSLERLDNLLSIAQAETADIDIFAPITEREECPICMLIIPLNENEIAFMNCCGKSICRGCTYKEVLTDLKNGIPEHMLLNGLNKCAFCRQSASTNNIKATKKLMKKNNPQAFMQMAGYYKEGDGVFQSDTKSLELYIRAAELGHPEGFWYIGSYFEQGSAVEQDKSKALAFYEEAAKKGSIYAHKTLANYYCTWDNQTHIKHVKVAASAGDQASMDYMMTKYKNNCLSKEDLTQSLLAYQASSNEMKSKDRDDANALFQATSK